jgi:hypothetical protein
MTESTAHEFHVPLCHDNRDVTPDVKLAVGVGCRYLDACMSQALLEGFTKYRMLLLLVSWT